MKLLAAKIVLGPLLIAQGRRVRREVLRLPEPDGERHGILGHGARRIRLLLVGDSAMAGVGATHQREALAARLGTHLIARLGRDTHRIEWRLVARSGLDTPGATALLDDAWSSQGDALRADIAVVGVGVNDVTAQAPVRRWLADLGRLVDRLQRRHGAGEVIVCGLPPMHRFPALPQPLRWYLGACARRHDAALRRWAAGRPDVRVVDLPTGGAAAMIAPDGFHPGPEGYRLWADRLAVAVAGALGH